MNIEAASEASHTRDLNTYLDRADTNEAIWNGAYNQARADLANDDDEAVEAVMHLIVDEYADLRAMIVEAQKMRIGRRPMDRDRLGFMVVGLLKRFADSHFAELADKAVDDSNR